MKLHDYQSEAVDWITSNERGFLWLKMGDGKTVIAATAIAKMGVPSVVVGTKRIIEDVWPNELSKWPHLRSLTYRSATASVMKRRAAVAAKPDILGVSYENLIAYLEMKDPIKRPFWIFDEITKMKSPSTRRFRMLQKAAAFERAFGLTATPTMEGHLGLWSQWKAIGGDDRLGRTISEFRNLFTLQFFRGSFTDYKIMPVHAERIEKLIAPHVFTIDDSRRPYHSQVVTIDVPISWESKTAAALYKRMEKDMVAELETSSFSVASKGVALNKCRQIATGFLYTPEGTVQFDTDKIDALVEAVEEIQGEQALVFYQFQHEREMLLEALPGAKPMDVNNYQLLNEVKIQTLVLHPRSCSHGLNLQRAGYAFFSTLPWSGEDYAQAVGRIDRQGQTGFPVVKRFIRSGTVDEDAADVVDGKITSQEQLIQRFRERTGWTCRTP